MTQTTTLNRASNRPRRRVALGALAGVLVLAAGTATAAAQPAPGERPAPRGPLAGPQVDDVRPPGGPRTFGEGGMMRRAMGAQNGTPIHIFYQALVTLNDGGDDIRPTEEQRDTINALLRDFEEQRTKHREANAEEIRELMQVVRPNRGERGQRGQRGERRGRGQQMELTDEQQAARDRIREIQQGAPSQVDLQERVWIVLSEAQQDHVSAEIALSMDADRGRRGGMRGEGERERERERRRGGAERDVPNAELLAERVAALHERIEKLTPEQQERVMQMIDRLIERIDTQLESQEQRAAPPDMDERRFFRN